jgi:hypothetical protein
LLCGAGALALAVPPLLLRAEPANWNGATGVRTTVEKLSPADRDRLDRNTQEYLDLTEAERQNYRDLHAFLQADAQDGNGRLSQTMQDYYAWLASNQSYDRQMLRTTTDPVLRVAEMQRIVDKRNEDFNRSRRRFSQFLLGKDAPDLSADELQALMAEVEGRVALTDEEQQRLLKDGQEKAGVERYFALFSILRSRNEHLVQLLDRLDPDDLLAAVPELEMPPSFAEAPVEAQRLIFLRMIIGNVMQEFELAVKTRPPTSGDLQKIVENWPADERQELDRLLELEPAEFRSELAERYAKETIALDIGDLWAMTPREAFGGRRFEGRNRGGPGDGGRGRGGFFPNGPRGEGPPLIVDLGRARKKGPRTDGPPPTEAVTGADPGPGDDRPRPPRR